MAHGDCFLSEDEAIVVLPELPPAEEDEAGVVVGRDRQRAGQLVQPRHTLISRLAEPQGFPEGERAKGYSKMMC
jgi:hypothetical protein